MISGDSSWYRWEGSELLLFLQVQPRAGRDQFVTPYGDHYKVRITAPPVDGKANDHLIRFLAKTFEVPSAQVSLESGQHSKRKQFRIRGPKKFPIPVEH